MSHQVVSVGYESRAVEDLCAALAEAGVEEVVDVRLNAVSRKQGASKRALMSALAASGIDYRHERALGNPQDNRAAFRRGSDHARRRYRTEVLHSADGHEAVGRVKALACRRRIALLCYEHAHADCHRQLIAEELAAAGMTTEELS